MTPRVAKKDERGIFRGRLARYASEPLAADHWDETNPIAPTEFRSWHEAAVLAVGPLVRRRRLSRRAVHDARHVFVAAKKGCQAFLTCDRLIHHYSAAIRQICGLAVPSEGW
jgi:hypothetical protein